MKKMIFLHEPRLRSFERNEVLKCLSSGWISPSGKNVKKFEEKLSKYTKSRLVLTNSGTSSLHLSLILSNIKNKDEVLVPTITFIATVNVILYLGASPVFIDNNSSDLNCDVKKILEFLKYNTYFKNRSTFNKKTKKRIKALIYTHVFGNISDLSYLKSELKKKNIKLIEDAAEAVGSFYKNKKHAGTQGDYGVLSFNTNKIITTSAGGALMLKSTNDYDRATKIIAQGKSNSQLFIHKELGYNYGMTNINASIGLGQLKDIKSIIEKKKRIHEIYQKNFKNYKNIKLIKFNLDTKPNFWLNSLELKNCNYSSLKKIVKNLNNLGIQVRPLWYPCHKQNYLKKYEKYNIVNAEYFYKRILCIPSSYFLKSKHIEYISKTIKDVVKKEIKQN
ncbi:MAG: DegT/DnrJ/EryC1/StrS family aminotransferase [Pseudomonadota bacterium]|nr:DegT/DnrJ/EryC1/StrS family aminotransferase [Pseudomonadota bacterium]